MHKNLKLFTVLAAAALLFAGCEQGGKEVAPALTFSGESATLLGSGINATAAGGDWTVAFTSATDWTISAVDTKAISSWLVVTPPAGTGGSVEAVITVLPNTGSASRSTKLSFVSGNIEESMTITQAGRSGISLTAVTLNESEIDLYVGKTFQLAATLTPSNADGEHTVTWTSSNPAVASVDGGLVTAIADGTAVITASVGNLSATCKVTVSTMVIPVASITLSESALELEIGDEAQLTATVSPSDASNPAVTWVSSDPEVATVQNGLVTAVGKGSAVITATAGEKSASCAVTVTQPGNGGEDMDDSINVNPW